MQMKAFSAISPLEIGDTVAVEIRTGKKWSQMNQRKRCTYQKKQ
jgi:hypothetical protein